MGYKLCTAEKPSVALDIAKVIGANKREDGFFIGNGYIVTWAVGHLVGLAEPEAYGYVSQANMYNKDAPEWRERALMELPLVPEKFIHIVLPDTEKQFNVMKKLMHREDVDYIIDCGDMGPEGHILQWLIRTQANCTKPVKRFCATSNSDEAIMEAMSNLVDVNKYMPIIRGEYCKKREDWILGMSLSRCASLIYNANIDVGRVQSPTLYFVVKRYLEVSSFKPKGFYQLRTNLSEGFSVFYAKDYSEKVSPEYKDSDNRILDMLTAQKFAKQIETLGSGVVSALETKNRSTNRPQLFDITELQRYGNRIFSYSADEVLKIAQSLYEKHKVLSYPRTDSRYITSDLEPYMKERILGIASHSEYSEVASNLLKAGLVIDNTVVDDSKVTDHYALIVTEKIKNFDMSVLSEKEKNILNLVITRMLVTFSDKYKYKETVVNISLSNGIVMAAKGIIPVSMGWKNTLKALMGKLDGESEESGSDESEEQFFGNIIKGQTVHVKNCEVLSKKTTAPKLHTEDTLLTAMENAGSVIENGGILKGKGIGTQSTRGAIIKSLFDKKYIVNQQKGKTNYLVPTKLGINVIRILPKDLYSPQITADWETKISHIVDGSLSEEQLMNEFITFINAKVRELRANKIEGLDFTNDIDSFGKCPFCGEHVIFGQYVDKKTGDKVSSYFCRNKECSFSLRKDNLIFKMRTGKDLTNSQIKKLISEGKIQAQCLNKNNVKYPGVFTLVKNEKGYAQLDFGFAKDSSAKKPSKKNYAIKFND